MDKQGVVPDTLVQNRHHRLLRASAAEKSEGVPRQTARDTRCLGPRQQPIQHLNKSDATATCWRKQAVETQQCR
jgi:hypothetical protein